MSTNAQNALALLTAQQSGGGIKNKVNFIQAQSQGSEDEQIYQMISAALTNAQDQLNTLNGALRLLAGAAAAVVIPTPGSVVAPGDAAFNGSVTGSIDSVTGYLTLEVPILPPSPLGTFIGCHLFLEIPDQSASPALVVGTSTVGGTAAVTGQWSPLDLGRQVYVASQQPWIVSFPIPDGIDPTMVTGCRLDMVSYSTGVENALIQFGKAGASPNQTFNLQPVIPQSPASGTTVTTQMGQIVATALTPDNSTGKLKTPVEVIVSSAPLGIAGWVGQLILTYGSADPTVVKNQFPVGPIFNTAGPVESGNDGITVPHSFAVDTPNTVQPATVWAITGLVDSSGNYQWNNIVPNVTPSFPITLGTTAGTIDAASVLLSSIQASMAVVSGQFGVAVGGITNPLLGSLAVDAGKLANSAVTATKIANLAVGTAAIQLLAVNNTLIANATITSTQIASATILGANIASATIVDANIANLSATKLTAGTVDTSVVTLSGVSGGWTTALTNFGLAQTSGTFYGDLTAGTFAAGDSSGSQPNAGFTRFGFTVALASTVHAEMKIVGGKGAVQFEGGSNYALWTTATGLKMNGALATLSGGTVTVATGLSSIIYAGANLDSNSTPSEFMSIFGSGGNLTVTSSNPASSAVVSWFAVGLA